VFARERRAVNLRRISAALIGMLYAIQTTPLYDRLRAAGRLNDDEAREKYGTNVSRWYVAGGWIY
jgi:hypothetical protein